MRKFPRLVSGRVNPFAYYIFQCKQMIEKKKKKVRVQTVLVRIDYFFNHKYSILFVHLTRNNYQNTYYYTHRSVMFISYYHYIMTLRK